MDMVLLKDSVNLDYNALINKDSKYTQEIFKLSYIDTILGPMVAIADEKNLYLLEFADRRGLEKEIERLRVKQKACF